MKQGVKRLLSMALALVAIVASFVIFFNGIQPQYAALVEGQSKLASLERLAEDRQTAVTKVQDLISDYSGDNASQLKSSISLALPLGVDMSSALVQLVGLVNLSGLQLQTLSPEVKPAQVADRGQVIRPVGTVAYGLSVQGSYVNFKNFLEKLETNVMIFNVESISIKPVRQGVDLLNINMVISSYYQQS